MRTTVLKQFGFKFMDPPVGAAVLDCRVISNPFQQGLSQAHMLERVTKHPQFNVVVQRGLQLIAENDVVWVGCLYGRHRSGAVAQALSDATGATIHTVGPSHN